MDGQIERRGREPWHCSTQRRKLFFCRLRSSWTGMWGFVPRSAEVFRSGTEWLRLRYHDGLDSLATLDGGQGRREVIE